MDDHATHARVDELTTTRLPGFVVVAAGEVGGELEVLIETTQTVTGCPDCGVLAVPHGRREHMVRDVPSANRAVRLVWSKRIWRCPEPACPTRTWSETSEQIRPRATLSERARRWACQRVGRDGHTVAAVARELGVGWGTVWRAVQEYGTPLVEDPHRLDDVTALGVDEHVVRREALLFRMEVKDHHRRVVVAVR